MLLLLLSAGTGCRKKNPVVEIQTPKGNITIELLLDQAPVTAGNFLDLVKNRSLDGGSFYRTVRGPNDTNPVKISVVQGGIGDAASGTSIKPIPHETTKTTGIKHLKGVVSMARSEPGSARAEFFICLDDSPELDFGGRRNPDGQGFAAFGRVLEGMPLMEQIWQGPAIGQKLDPSVRIHKVIVK
jgi:peptidyl-prolyl cis-trans isomerase A (cyclophilin A)